MSEVYRSGAIGALLDEYERAIADLLKVIEPISNSELIVIIDPHTEDDNCRSIQTMLTHVVNAGYGYATSIHNYKGDTMVRPAIPARATANEYIDDIKNVFQFTEDVFKNLTEDDVQSHDNNLKIMSGWGQLYDVEQMMEHAIVHILRHRRQLERFREKLNIGNN